jgi:hypothetical protein
MNQTASHIYNFPVITPISGGIVFITATTL